MGHTYRTYEQGQTIAAIATPPGVGGIAIIRISGDNAINIANTVFSGPIHQYVTHTAHFGTILDIQGNAIDGGLALIMKKPKSYTGEDTVELHCHGGLVVSRKVLEAVLAAGASPALPGEFTFKAFQNGKIDLTRAEAVQEVIASKSELAWQVAENHLEGKLYNQISSFQKKIIDVGAVVEAWIDFPEEGLETSSKASLLDSLKKTLTDMTALHQSFHDGKILHTYFSLCLIGSPNVGKSSLMNALTGKKRAIVTHIPGTTRDILEEEVQIAGLTFHLLDTAGIRETTEIIEKEGVSRSYKAAHNADLILLVLDVTHPTNIPSQLPPKKTIAIWNKTDLQHTSLPSLPFPHQVKVSAKEGLGLHSLKKEIHRILWQKNPPSKEEVVLTNARHYHALGSAITSLAKAVEGMDTEVSPEFLISDIHHSLKELDTIIGINITEEILNTIFSKFCVGK